RQRAGRGRERVHPGHRHTEREGCAADRDRPRAGAGRGGGQAEREGERAAGRDQPLRARRRTEGRPRRPQRVAGRGRVGRHGHGQAGGQAGGDRLPAHRPRHLADRER
ncbi:hypothetical protein LTR94_035756, partial [Friedmanniomyces endolithicus]